LLPPAGSDLTLLTTVNRRWVDHVFYAVDADLGAGRREDRHLVRLRRFEGQRLTFAIPKDTRTALGAASKVRIFCVSNLEIKLKKALLGELKTSTRGEAVEQLWSDQATELRPSSPHYLAAPLNRGQQLAFAAMTTPGGFFVWGPPGTGKTKVITAAVRDAMEHGRSVLIASHTHAAVDNVLEGLAAAPQSGADEFRLRPGDAVRNASLSVHDRVSSSVKEHEFLMVDKAAAVLTNQVARRAKLDAQHAANSSHETRVRLSFAIRALSAVDVDGLRAARSAVVASAEVERLERTERDSEHAAEIAAEHARRGRAAAASIDVSEADLRRSHSKLDEAESSLRAAHDALSVARAELEAVGLDLEATKLRLMQAREDVERWTARAWPPARRKHVRRVSDLEIREKERTAALLRGTHRNDQLAQEYQRARHDTDRARADRELLDERAVEVRRLLEAAVQHDEEGAAATVRLLEVRARIAELRGAIAAVPRPHDVLARAEEQGWLPKLAEVDELNARVTALDKEREGVQRQIALLEDEVRNTRARLLSEAPVVASTLASLSTQPQLRERRFDVVVLDEVASAEPGYVVHAGSRANLTLALVGDFLQNAPIAEPEDPRDDAERKRAEWQEKDIFGLAGITDRPTAEHHPRCVTLQRQYRYPSIVAELVNAFCYDGLLESQRRSIPSDGPTITLFDTSRHINKTLQRADGSWYSQLGLDLLSAVARSPASQSGTVGFVTPYRPQADRAESLCQSESLDVQCGTSHRFQGREFDIVIVDLMQDGTLRWIGGADLRGTKRQRSAAKLLNVALTRAKRQLFLIGDWEFIQRYDSPGMCALAELDGHPNFLVVQAAEVLKNTEHR
jgi:hypothetical protein